ncbi:respiratory complex assembly protein Rmp1 [Penicillium brasilianum]|uniref:Respiratory complex assembly protein Rmp1 n=1 Tax=Penicillium brasilianum TaxID=104259 RepID=A0A1S9S1V1_PENBI|nr:respiratory complex assembly protein Rmp1 [Penicillium brasilianum]
MRRHPRSALGSWSSSALPRPSISSCTPWCNSVNIRFQSSSSGSDKPFPSPDESNERAPRRRRRSGRDPKPKRLPLNVDSLGKPGEIVVVPTKRPRTLKERLRDMQNREDAQTQTETQTVTLSSMLEDLEAEYAPLTPSAIHERIESYKASEGLNAKMNESEWEAVRNSLASSFTYTQLSEYIEEHERYESKGDGTAGRWRPGTSAFLHANPELHTGVTNRVATSQDLKGKALLAERILRDCWQLSIADEVGQLDLRLSPALIGLLLNAKHFSFDEVATMHQSSIDITSSLGLVRITGRQNACESMCEIVLDAIARIREEPTGLDTLTSRPDLNQIYPPTLLEWISKTYGVALENGTSQVPEKILYLAENKDGANNARRILNLALHEVTPASVPFSTYFPASEPANIYNYNPEGSMSWLDRQKKWFRWAMPSTQSAETENNPTPLFDSHQTRLSDHLLNLLRQTPVPTPSPGGGLKVHESVTAAVGRCLFTQKPSLENSTITPSQLGKLSLPRTFSTDIPRIINFLASLRPITPVVGAQVHNIRLTPSAAYASLAPTLDIKIASKLGKSLLNPEDSFNVQSIKFIRGSTAVDYLLPENGLDLRFTRTVYHELSGDALEESVEFLDFVRSIESSLRSIIGSAVTSHDSTPLPVFCQVLLPSNFVQPGASTGGSPSITAEYMLPPIQNPRGSSLQLYELADRQLRYSYSETGPFLAARTIDVSLDMRIPTEGMDGDQSQPSLETEFHSFYNAACRMAFDIHGSKLLSLENEDLEPHVMY